MRQTIIDKMNEGQEADTAPYTWETIPNGLKEFWSKNL